MAKSSTLEMPSLVTEAYAASAIGSAKPPGNQASQRADRGRFPICLSVVMTAVTNQSRHELSCISVSAGAKIPIVPDEKSPTPNRD